MTPVFVNNWSAELLAPVAASSDQIDIPAAAASLLPEIGPGRVCTITISESSSGEGPHEIVRVVAVDGGQITVARAQEGTAAADWPAGSIASVRLTAAAFEMIASEIAQLQVRVTELEESPQPALAVGGILWGEDGRAQLYDADWRPLPAPLASLAGGMNSFIRAAAASPDGSMVAVAESGAEQPFYIYSSSTWSRLNPFEPDLEYEAGLAVAFSPDGSLLAAATEYSGLIIYDTSDFAIMRTLPYDGVRGMSFSPDGSLLALARYSETEVIDTRTWAAVPGTSIDQSRAVAFSPDGAELAVAIEYPASVARYSVADWSAIASPPYSGGTCHALAYSDNGVLAIGHDAAPYLTLWDGPAELPVLEPPTAPVHSLLWFDAGLLALSSSADQPALIYAADGTRSTVAVSVTNPSAAAYLTP